VSPHIISAHTAQWWPCPLHISLRQALRSRTPVRPGFRHSRN
jgi:hypothetical protein